MKLENEKQVIRVRLPDGQCGTVIGVSEETIGILLDCGEYMDVPEGATEIIISKK